MSTTCVGAREAFPHQHRRAAAATAVLHQLALHPEWQDRVRAESSAEIGNGQLSLDALDRMQSLGMVISESMRLFAPVPTIFRKALVDTSIQGYSVPAHTIVVVAPALNHYWPGLWTEPRTFDPERFSDSRREDKSHRLAFMPFGAGAHKCIGMHFASMVVKVVIHHLLRDYRIEMRPGYTLEWDMTALPAPTDGFQVLVRRVDDYDQRNITASPCIGGSTAATLRRRILRRGDQCGGLRRRRTVAVDVP
jgi:cytochrome P450